MYFYFIIYFIDSIDLRETLSRMASTSEAMCPSTNSALSAWTPKYTRYLWYVESFNHELTRMIWLRRISRIYTYFGSRKSLELNNLTPVYFYFIIYFIDSIDLRETLSRMTSTSKAMCPSANSALSACIKPSCPLREIKKYTRYTRYTGAFFFRFYRFAWDKKYSWRFVKLPLAPTGGELCFVVKLKYLWLEGNKKTPRWGIHRGVFVEII